jgi:hypothetical protein
LRCLNASVIVVSLKYYIEFEEEVCSQSGNKWRSAVSKHIVGVRLLEKNLGCANPHLQLSVRVTISSSVIHFKSNSSSVFCASWATLRGIILYSVYWTGQPCNTFLPLVMRNRASGFFLIAY